MPGITNPAEEYFKDGLWGWVTNAWKKLVATAGGALHIQFAGQEADVEVTQTTPADLTTGGHGWDGDSWQKLPMLWGYSDRYVENLATTTGAAGARTLQTTGGDDGEVRVIESVAVINSNTAPTSLVIQVEGAGLYALLAASYSLVINQWYIWNGHITLKEGDIAKVYFYDCALDDDVAMMVWGHKMKVAE